MLVFWFVALMATTVVQGRPSGNATSTSATTTAANSSSTAIPNWVYRLPSCAVNCMIDGFETSICTLDEPVCMCSNQDLLSTMSVCVQLSCSMTNQEVILETERDLCKGYPVPNRGKPLKVVSSVLLAITLPIVILRIVSRWFIARQIGFDDWAIFIATVLLFVSTVVDSTNITNGFGRHIWSIDASELSTLLKAFWIGEILYVTILSLTKISILLFYHRIFVEKWFLICVKITICFIVLYAIAFIAVLVFQCDPVAGVWDRTLPRKCLSLHAVVYSNAAISIFQDILVLILPIPELLSLQINTRKKIGVIIMFSVGIFAFATSCIRLNYLVSFDNSLDTSWDDVDTTLWSLIELNISIICTCLPALRALGGHFLPDFFRTSNRGTQYCYSQKNQGISRGTKTPSHLNENFITMPESLIEDNYRDENVFRNTKAIHPTRPLSVPSDELELVKTHTQARDRNWKANMGVELGVGVWSKRNHS